MQSVIENEVSLEVCIVLSNTNLERDIIITVATQSDTATGIYKIMHVCKYFSDIYSDSINA